MVRRLGKAPESVVGPLTGDFTNDVIASGNPLESINELAPLLVREWLPKMKLRFSHTKIEPIFYASLVDAFGSKSHRTAFENADNMLNLALLFTSAPESQNIFAFRGRQTDRAHVG